MLFRSLFHVAPRDELLRAVESAQLGVEECSLTLLPGRYAFLVKAKPAAILKIAAGQT